MKLAIDITTTQDQFSTRGVGNYTRQLVGKLLEQHNQEANFHLLGYGKKDTWMEAFTAFDINWTKVKWHSLGELKPTSPANLWHWQQDWLPIIKEINPHIYFCPEMQRGVPVGITKTITTIHDVIPVITKSYSNTGGIKNWLKGIFYRRQLNQAIKSDRIITVSNFSASEIIKVTQLNRHKIVVTPLGLTNRQVTPTDQKHWPSVRRELDINLDIPLIVYNGGLQANKNPQLVIAAFQELISTGVQAQLGFVALGNNYEPNATAIYEQIKQLPLATQKLIKPLPRLSELQMNLLLNHADAFIHMASYEGFGLAALEALSLGIPSVLANNECYQEVVARPELLINIDATLAAQRLQQILTNKSYSSKLSKIGQEVAARYNWDTTAQLTWQAITELNSK